MDGATEEQRPAKIRRIDYDGEGALDAVPVGASASVAASDPAAAAASDTRDPAAADDSPPTPPQKTPLLDVDGNALSKKQQKRERKRAEWTERKDERRAHRRERNQARKQRKRDSRQAEVAANGGVEPASWAARRAALLEESKTRPVQLPVTLLFDCDFDDLMRDHERVSLAGQLTRSYSDNRNAKLRAHLAVASFGGKLRERFDSALRGDYAQWKGIQFLEDDFVDAAEKARAWMVGGDNVLEGQFEKYNRADGDATTTTTAEEAGERGEIVYLSSDSQETLTELKPYSTYIIGGLVDKNREKGLCQRRATERGVRTARLPIGDYLDMASRKVLATNHVSQIMVEWLRCGDWGEAFMKAIPRRKEAQLRGSAKEGVDGEDGTENAAQGEGEKENVDDDDGRDDDDDDDIEEGEKDEAERDLDQVADGDAERRNDNHPEHEAAREPEPQVDYSAAAQEGDPAVEPRSDGLKP